MAFICFSFRLIDLLSVQSVHPLAEVHLKAEREKKNQIHSFLCFILNHVNNMRQYLSKFSCF